MPDTLEDKCASYVIIKNWTAEFKRDRTEVKDEHAFVCLLQKTLMPYLHDLIWKIVELVLNGYIEDYERIFHIVHHELGMRKLSAKWIPKCLHTYQKDKG